MSEVSFVVKTRIFMEFMPSVLLVIIALVSFISV